MCTSVHGADDWFWHVLFALWICVNGLTSLGHDLCVRRHSFQSPQHPSDGLMLGRFGKYALNRNDTLLFVPLSMELMIAGDTFHLPCGCIELDL